MGKTGWQIRQEGRLITCAAQRVDSAFVAEAKVGLARGARGRRGFYTAKGIVD